MRGSTRWLSRRVRQKNERSYSKAKAGRRPSTSERGCGPGKREIDAAGRWVLPGGIDSHCHVEQLSGMGLMCADDFYSATVSAARLPARPGHSTASRCHQPTISTLSASTGSSIHVRVPTRLRVCRRARPPEGLTVRSRRTLTGRCSACCAHPEPTAPGAAGSTGRRGTGLGTASSG